MNFEGVGVAKNEDEGIRWYRKAAQRGYPSAQSQLGFIYKNSAPPKRNMKEAAKWLTEAAKQGDAHAQANLALMYESGEGVKRNDAEAFKWFEKASLQHHLAAQKKLAAYYEAGRGTPRDLVKSYMWYGISGVWANQGEEVSEDDPRMKLMKSMTEAEIEEGERLAADWWMDHFREQPATETP